MKDLRIVFMGTPEFAVASLKAILKAQYNVVGVVTAPDRPAGRGQKLRKSAVKEFAQKENLKILQPTNLKSTDFIEELSSLSADIQVVVAFRMLPETVWKMPKWGTFNLHASLLPNYRGAAPINWAIINGEIKTGVSTFFIDEHIDTGAIIKQEEEPINPNDNAGSLHDRLMDVGSKLVVDTLHLVRIDGVKLEAQSQNAKLNTAFKLDRENTRIDWDLPLKNINDKIRGLSPYPVAWTFFLNNGKEKQLKIYKAQPVELTEPVQEGQGKITVASNKLYVTCNDGVLEILELQMAGKRKMIAKDLLNGFSFSKDAKML